MSRVPKGFSKIFLDSRIKHFKNFRRNSETISHTTEQADSPPLRYVTVMAHVCIVFLLLVSSKS